MVFSDGLKYLDKLLQKSLIFYKHHQLNYEESLHRGVVPKGLRIRKDPLFEPISDDFQMKRKLERKWSEIIYTV